MTTVSQPRALHLRNVNVCLSVSVLHNTDHPSSSHHKSI